MILIIFITVLFPVFSNSINNTINHDVSMELHSIIRPDIEISVIIMACLVCCIVTIGIIGNVLVICVLTCNQTRMVYETFCVGLAVTDLIYLTMTSPITVMQYFLKSWIFGIFWCKVFNFIVQNKMNFICHFVCMNRSYSILDNLTKLMNYRKWL
uniref:Protein trapped in endoderm-1 n=1 Tax=Schistosoma haematobium TaxID=6185 RepID=A0A094ZL79_SCHHA